MSIVTARSLRLGQVRDRTIPSDMLPGIIHKTNSSGFLKIVQFYKNNSVDIEFLNTGFTTTTRIRSIREGTVKDKTLIRFKKGRKIKPIANWPENSDERFKQITRNGNDGIAY